MTRAELWVDYELEKQAIVDVIKELQKDFESFEQKQRDLEERGLDDGYISKCMEQGII